MDNFQFVYANRAQAYHEMIAAEDADQRLLPALQEIVSFQGKRVLDLGSGSGRIPLLVHRMAASLLGLDLNLPMLREQQVQRRRAAGEWRICQADMRSLPVRNGWADVVVAGWAIGHLRSWFEGDWKTQISLILNEMGRVSGRGGANIILETLGTGSLTPAPPTPGLAEFYAWLENEHGFTRRAIPTDYVFGSVEEAVQKTEFFFGSELAQTIRRNGWARLPEWTGVWSRTAGV